MLQFSMFLQVTLNNFNDIQLFVNIDTCMGSIKLQSIFLLYFSTALIIKLNDTILKSQQALKNYERNRWL